MPAVRIDATSTAPLLNADQAGRLRQLVPNALPPGRTLAITSGKGGVGKTNVAVNLSICLAQRGYRVTLVDADLGLANADMLFNLHPRYNLSHVLSGAKAMEDVCLMTEGGVRFVPGGSGLDHLADLSELERQSLIHHLFKLARSTDIMVFDCGAGLSRNMTFIASAVDEVMVVTTPEPTAMADAYAVLKVLYRKRPNQSIRVIVNMVADRCEAQEVFGRLSGVARKFLNLHIADAGFLVHDTLVERSVRQRSPVVLRYPRSMASDCFAVVTERMASAILRHSKPTGFFERMLQLLGSRKRRVAPPAQA